jgi:hypothetical protein
MSDSYEINGVKITPYGGGYYDLTHPSLAAPERVRGKETADARAAAIAAASPRQDGGDDDGNAPLRQGDIAAVPQPPADITSTQTLDGKDAGENAPEPAPKPSPEAQQAASMAADQDISDLDPEPRKGEDPRDAQIRVMQAQMRSVLEALQNVTTVQATQAPPIDQVPHSIPRQFSGEMDAATKKALKSAGVGVSTIILEENESIPPTGLFIGHNGRSYMIKPGEKVDVPDFLISVLDDAVMSSPLVDASTQKVLGYRDRSKYPYRRV